MQNIPPHIFTAIFSPIIFFVLLFTYTRLAGPIPFDITSITTSKSDAFTVTGEGKVEAKPDSATVHLGVVAKGATSELAQSGLNTNINKVIEDCVEKYRFQAHAKKISLTADLEPLFPIQIDDALVSKVMSNLIDNAIKYSEENAYISITSRESLKNKGYIEIQVRDTGIGISSHDLEHLCEKFYRSKNDYTIKNKGTGLGLYLSRYFLNLHRGFLLVDSKEGTGSIFTVLLPTEENVFRGERHA